MELSSVFIYFFDTSWRFVVCWFLYYYLIAIVKVFTYFSKAT